MPALDAQRPSSTSAPASASMSRAAYGAPEAPVIPRKMRTSGLFRALGGQEELRQLPELLIREAELGHHRVAELGRVLDVVLEELLRAALGSLVAQVGRALVRAPGAEVGVTGRAAGAREDLGAFESLLVVGEALTLRPRRYCLDHLTRQRLLRGRALVGEHTHREDDQHGADDGHRTTREPALAAPVHERED